MEKGGRVPLVRKLAELVSREWQTAAEIQRMSGGETPEVAKTLDRLWEGGLIERETLDIGIGARRKGGGAQLRRIRYMRRMSKP
ncbi:hypothetical protein [Bradyrhizobium elkanii]|uniref:Putative transcriptional regulator n=1 Tax=Bradyrhizobium elkanii TaxID=29448 RepID=A0A8I1Y7J7_BRAEL|nr:hypothetical protein [Bradyrhizobium elkanii]MBP1294222.1 putative transcriptional regulator [Bradyrhizobium elkanii]